MQTTGIRFNNNLYVNITVDGDEIKLYTVDKEGNIQDYEVSKKSRSKKSTKKED